MMAARVAGVPRPVCFIASDSSLSSRLWPAVCIAVKSVPSVNRLGGLVFFFRASISTISWSCPWARSTGRICSGVFSSALPFASRFSSFRPNVQDLPTHLLHDGSGGSIAVDEFSMSDGGNHSRDSLKVIVMPHHEEASADKTVNLAFLFG